ncbi:hypothetical protein [Nannocystis pusilla]|uniref:Uncharacterized protein n=1 Tax=Nannocystis pusilla TaxID=889268 RepID=A0ABS7TMH0_9BACT|nr:hypothetical protein [Nannocystis pusilla]MBZ5709416.1 hypothetical protein [Nannocystis pusilla]
MSAHDHPDVVGFVAWMTGSKRAGADVLAEVPRRGEPDVDARVREIIRWFMDRRLPSRGRGASVNLDAILRGDTIPLDMSHPLIRGDARRLNVLQRALQSKCLLTALCNVAPGPRAAFILRELMGWSARRLDGVFETPTAARVNHTRGVANLDKYLGVRCEHMDPGNPCRCHVRLGAALAQEFITWPGYDRFDSEKPLTPGKPQTIHSLMRSLQPPA